MAKSTVRRVIDPVTERSVAQPVTITVRPEVAAFAVAMERKLAANDHKEHWSNMTYPQLFNRLCDETKELNFAMFHRVRDPEHVLEEAADVVIAAASTARHLGIDLSAAVRAGLQKNRERVRVGE